MYFTSRLIDLIIVIILAVSRQRAKTIAISNTKTPFYRVLTTVLSFQLLTFYMSNFYTLDYTAEKQEMMEQS